AEKDPKLALQIAREVLEKGDCSEVISLIYQLREKDPEAASKLVKDVIERIRLEDLSKNESARNAALSLLSVFRSTIESNDKSDKKNDLFIDERTFRDLLDMVASAALTISSNNKLLDPVALSNARMALMQLQPMM